MSRIIPAAGALDLLQVADMRVGGDLLLPQGELRRHRDAVHWILQIVHDHACQVILELLGLLA